MTAVIYARYSSDNQREESIEGQIRECTAYCTLKRQLSKRLSFFFFVSVLLETLCYADQRT